MNDTKHSVDPPVLEAADAAEQELRNSHLALQTLATKYAIIPCIALFIVFALLDRCWHNWAVLVAFLGMSVAWMVGLRLTRKGQLGRAVAVFAASAIAFEGFTLFVMHGNLASALLGCTILIAYTSLFSKRLLYMATGATLAVVLASQITSYLRPFEPKMLEGIVGLAYDVGFITLLLPLCALVLQRSNAIKDSLVARMAGMNRQQSMIIETAREVTTVLDDVVRQMERFSEQFSTRAAEQASTIAETSMIMEQVREIAADNAASAAATRDEAQSTLGKSVESSDALRAVEAGFDEVVGTNEVARAESVVLAAEAESIEEVLRSNREIAAQIKILAINAGIQAAKAGEVGAGFRVVARELKSMINDTEQSLADSRALLESIRLRARQNAELIESGATLLKHQFKELNHTGQVIEDISASFVDTAAQFGGISEASQQQQSRLDGVGVGMSQINESANELTRSSRLLSDTVQQIVDSQERLREVLGSAGGS